MGAESTLIIFDWDDTFLPTTFLRQWFLSPAAQKENSSDEGKTFGKDLAKICNAGLRLLETAEVYGEILFITNGSGDWIKASCIRFLPGMWPRVARYRRISAKEAHGEISKDPFVWKRHCFLCELTNFLALKADATTTNIAHASSSSSSYWNVMVDEDEEDNSTRSMQTQAETPVRHDRNGNSYARASSGGSIHTPCSKRICPVFVSVGDSLHERHALHYFYKLAKGAEICVRTVKFIPLPDCTNIAQQLEALAEDIAAIADLSAYIKAVDFRYYFDNNAYKTIPSFNDDDDDDLMENYQCSERDEYYPGFDDALRKVKFIIQRILDVNFVTSKKSKSGGLQSHRRGDTYTRSTTTASGGDGSDTGGFDDYDDANENLPRWEGCLEKQIGEFASLLSQNRADLSDTLMSGGEQGVGGLPLGGSGYLEAGAKEFKRIFGRAVANFLLTGPKNNKEGDKENYYRRSPHLENDLSSSPSSGRVATKPSIAKRVYTDGSERRIRPPYLYVLASDLEISDPPTRTTRMATREK